MTEQIRNSAVLEVQKACLVRHLSSRLFHIATTRSPQSVIFLSIAAKLTMQTPDQQPGHKGARYAALVSLMNVPVHATSFFFALCS